MTMKKEYVDDLSGKPLITSMVKTARAEEMEQFYKYKVWTKVPINEAWEVTGELSYRCSMD